MQLNLWKLHQLLSDLGHSFTKVYFWRNLLTWFQKGINLSYCFSHFALEGRRFMTETSLNWSHYTFILQVLQNPFCLLSSHTKEFFWTINKIFICLSHNLPPSIPLIILFPSPVSNLSIISVNNFIWKDLFIYFLFIHECCTKNCWEVISCVFIMGDSNQSALGFYIFTFDVRVFFWTLHF